VSVKGGAKLDEWRQGDLVLTELLLPIMGNADGALEVMDVPAVHGVMIVSQSCDIVKPVEHRPFIQVASLVPVEENEMSSLQKGMRPSLVYVPGLGDKLLAADLDMCATVEKTALELWNRTPGCLSDEHQRQLGTALSRHRQRFAFPNEFNTLVTPLRRWFERKVGKDSAGGRFADRTREVRVLVDDWENPKEITFFVILKGPPDEAERQEWAGIVKNFEGYEMPKGYPQAEYQLVTLDDISATEYVTSAHLDWDGLSDTD
jgi:hypothetical protein